MAVTIASGEYTEHGNSIRWEIDDHGLLTIWPIFDGAAGVLARGNNATTPEYPWQEYGEAITSARFGGPVAGTGDVAPVFSGCANITALDLANYNPSSAIDTRAILDACPSLVSMTVNPSLVNTPPITRDEVLTAGEVLGRFNTATNRDEIVYQAYEAVESYQRLMEAVAERLGMASEFEAASHPPREWVKGYEIGREWTFVPAHACAADDWWVGAGAGLMFRQPSDDVLEVLGFSESEELLVITYEIPDARNPYADQHLEERSYMLVASNPTAAGIGPTELELVAAVVDDPVYDPMKLAGLEERTVDDSPRKQATQANAPKPTTSPNMPSIAASGRLSNGKGGR